VSSSSVHASPALNVAVPGLVNLRLPAETSLERVSSQSSEGEIDEVNQRYLESLYGENQQEEMEVRRDTYGSSALVTIG